MFNEEIMVSINMQDFVDYEDPQGVPEWVWVKDYATFSHLGNYVDPGVHEYILHLPTTPIADSGVLQDILQRAKMDGVTYVLVRQG